MRSLTILIVAAALSSCAARAQDSDPIHADLPLWTNDAAHIWPQHFQDGTSFGCAHRIQLGDWSFEPNKDQLGIEGWYRFSNYGVIHCFIVERQAYTAERLTGGAWKYSVFIDLGLAEGRQGKPVELWALQSGARPGSDYLLLSRSPGKEAIDTFDVLQHVCPKGAARETENIDILLTRYCAINSQAELRALAQRMARLPALGTLRYVRPEPEDKDAPVPTK